MAHGSLSSVTKLFDIIGQRQSIQVTQYICIQPYIQLKPMDYLICSYNFGKE